MVEATVHALRSWDKGVVDRGLWMGGPAGSASHSNEAAELGPSSGGAAVCAPWSAGAASWTPQSLLFEQVCMLCFLAGQCLSMDSMMGQDCRLYFTMAYSQIRPQAVFPNQMVSLARICV